MAEDIRAEVLAKLPWALDEIKRRAEAGDSAAECVAMLLTACQDLLGQVSTLAASLAEAQAEKEDAEQRLANLKENEARIREHYLAQNAELRAENTRLQGYVQHKADCKKWHKPLPAADDGVFYRGWGRLSAETRCTCGLDPAPLPKEPTTP